jgi:hypothetical protein
VSERRGLLWAAAAADNGCHDEKGHLKVVRARSEIGMAATTIIQSGCKTTMRAPRAAVSVEWDVGLLQLHGQGEGGANKTLPVYLFEHTYRLSMTRPLPSASSRVRACVGADPLAHAACVARCLPRADYCLSKAQFTAAVSFLR